MADSGPLCFYIQECLYCTTVWEYFHAENEVAVNLTLFGWHYMKDHHLMVLLYVQNLNKTLNTTA